MVNVGLKKHQPNVRGFLVPKVLGTRKCFTIRKMCWDTSAFIESYLHKYYKTPAFNWYNRWK